MATESFFRSLELVDWRQFGKVELDLDSPVVVLTGVNGSGKTTILRLLAYFAGEATVFLSTPQRAEDTGKVEWFSGFSKRFFSDLFKSKVPSAPRTVGTVELTTGQRMKLTVPVMSGGPQVSISVPTVHKIDGIFISSHRPLYYYEQLKELRIERTTKKGAFSEYVKAMRNQSLVGQKVNNISSRIKSSLLNWGYVGYGTKIAPPDDELIQNFEGFEDVLRKIFPSEIKFLRYEIRSGSEIVFITEDGEFLFETASGGITSLIHLAWMIYNFAEDGACTVLIDEIENHLHPSLQRIVLPNLIAAFPLIRFIVTTHSPLVVSSVRDARIYALHHDDDGRIKQSVLDFAGSAQTAGAVLDRVLGVPVTMPVWAEREYERIIEKYTAMDAAQIDLKAFRNELRGGGLEAFVLEGVESILQRK